MQTRIKVVGIGGAGGNTIDRLCKARVPGIELIAINTDAQDLQKKRAFKKIRIGREATHGLGTGMKPELGRIAVEENLPEVEEALKDSDIVFITAGLGGGTGSGAMPVVGEKARKSGALIVGVVTLPFSFEGKKRRSIANKALKRVGRTVDTLVVIQNDKLLSSEEDVTVDKAFSRCDTLLREAVESISNVIINPGILNLDFSDIKQILRGGGSAFFGVGKAKGKDRAMKAIDMAISSSVARFPLERAGGILFNIASGVNDFSLSEVKQISKIIKQKTSSKTKVVFGMSFDGQLARDEIRITVIATSPKDK